MNKYNAERISVGIVIFDGVEVLDFSGPFEVFSVTRVDEAQRYETQSPFAVSLIAEEAGPVVCTGGMKVLPQRTFSDCPSLDILVVPGGLGTRTQMKNDAMASFVTTQAQQVEVLASVCTGALILGSAGLLDGLRATTHWRSLALMQRLFPQIDVDQQAHVVEDGKVISSAGISAGIDMALRLVARYCGESVARATARHMEYPFPESDLRRVEL